MSDKLRKIAFNALSTTISEMGGCSEHFCETFDYQEIMFALYPEEEWVTIFKEAKDQLQEEIDKGEKWINEFNIKNYPELSDYTIRGLADELRWQKKWPEHRTNRVSDELIDAAEAYYELYKKKDD